MVSKRSLPRHHDQHADEDDEDRFTTCFFFSPGATGIAFRRAVPPKRRFDELDWAKDVPLFAALMRDESTETLKK